MVDLRVGFKQALSFLFLLAAICPLNAQRTVTNITPTSLVTDPSINSGPATITQGGQLTIPIYGGGGVPSVNGITGAVTIAAGTNITIGVVGGTITINGTGGGGGGTTSPFPQPFLSADGTLDLGDAAPGTGTALNINSDGTIYTGSGIIWANPNSRLIYDQFSEQAISTMSDTYNTDSTTPLIPDADNGIVAVNGVLLVRDGLQIQSFGFSTTVEIQASGEIDLSGDPGISGYVMTSQASGQPPIWSNIASTYIPFSDESSLSVNFANSANNDGNGANIASTYIPFSDESSLSVNFANSATYATNAGSGGQLYNTSGSAFLDSSEDVRFDVVNLIYDSGGSPGSSGQILVNSGSGALWQSLITSNDIVGQTGSNASIVTVTPSANHTFRVGAYVNITALTTDSIQVQVTYTDIHGNPQTANLGSPMATQANSTYSPIDIRAGAGLITVLTTDTGLGTSAYDVGATIQQLN